VKGVAGEVNLGQGKGKQAYDTSGGKYGLLCVKKGRGGAMSVKGETEPFQKDGQTRNQGDFLKEEKAKKKKKRGGEVLGQTEERGWIHNTAGKMGGRTAKSASTTSGKGDGNMGEGVLHPGPNRKHN